MTQPCRGSLNFQRLGSRALMAGFDGGAVTSNAGGLVLREVEARFGFIVTSLSAEAFDAKTLYEQEYCVRGDMENRIKENPLHLLADRVSCQTMRANQVWLCLSTVAHIVMRALREFGLAETDWATGQCDSLRVKVLKIGAVIRVSVRRVWVASSEAYPFREMFERVCANLNQLMEGPWPSAALPWFDDSPENGAQQSIRVRSVRRLEFRKSKTNLPQTNHSRKPLHHIWRRCYIR